jgi:DNA topoisomerase I
VDKKIPVSIILGKELNMPLVLIESPNKISKLKKILGPSYVIMASVGHIMDLSKKNLGVELDNFKATYQINKDKKDIAKDIKREALNHEIIYIATDPDREGEAIAFHLATLLPKKGVSVYRTRFNAITKEAVKKAIKSPEKLDEDLYNAQQARRITDRLVGFKVSPVMWNKGLRGTSAGRVQSVALKVIADREKDVKKFVPEEYWEICAKTSLDFDADFWGINGKTFRIPDQAKADAITGAIESSGCDLMVTESEGKSRSRKPAPPFITSTLQQSASNRFGWSAKKSMSVAQSLFGNGLITYHRTDSTRSDPQKISDLRDKIEKKHGKQYMSKAVVVYGPKSSSQDAHEAIRPTYDSPVSTLSSDEKKLLALIGDRFMASQMADAKFDQVSLKFECKTGGKAYNFKKNGSTMLFDGFLKVYGEIKDDVVLPSLSVGDSVSWDDIISTQHFTKPPPRFSDASIIKLLEKLGVGRPSTYASIIDTLLNRKYVKREKRSLAATEIGIMVSDYLTETFPAIVDAKFTSKMEMDLDEIAGGKISYVDTLKDFNANLDTQIQTATTSGLPKAFSVDSKCPKCSLGMVKKISKHGAFLGCSDWPTCDGTLSIDGESKAKTSVETGHKCPKCSNILLQREGKNGDFFGCKSYPACKYTATVGEDGSPKESTKKAAKSTGVSCPKCKKGDMLERNGKYGKFYGCSGFPKCKNIMKTV